MKELTVFNKMTTSTAELIKVVKDEIGVKCCQAFAIRAIDALCSLDLKTESLAKKAANVFLDNLQTLHQGGVISEDYDMIDFVKRGNTITISARVQALLRACRRKGFMVIDSIVAVPKGDDIYFEEVYKDNVGFIYLLRDKRINLDREMTAERLVDGYFDKFLCRLEIRDLKKNVSIMTCTEITNQEMLTIQSSSDRGIFLSEWVEVSQGKYTKKQKVIYDGSDGFERRLNKDSFWCKYTSEMVRKSIIRKALKNVKETIPELQDAYLAFDDEPIEDIPVTPTKREVKIEGIKDVNKIDLDNLTDEQKEDVQDVLEIYLSNPEMAKVDAEKIKEIYETGKETREIINEFYAELTVLARSKDKRTLIEPILKGENYEKDKH